MPLPLTVGPGRALLAPPSDPIAGLRAGLVSSWRLQEASGPRLDSVGLNTLTSNNNVGAAAGPNGFQAASLVSASTQYLSLASNSTVQVAGTSWTWGVWMYIIDVGGNHVLVSKGGEFTTTTEYCLYRYTDSKVYCDLSIAGTAKQVGSGSTLSAGAWHYVVAWYDAVAQTLNLRIDNGAAQSVATGSGTITNTATALQLGWDGTVNHYANGRLALVAFWKRVLSAAEQTQLYAGGAGVAL